MIHPLEKYLNSIKKTNLIFDFDETIVRLILPWEKSTDRIKEELIKLDPKPLEDYKKQKIGFSELQNTYVLKFGDEALKLFIKDDLDFEREDLIKYLLNDNLIDLIKKLENYKMAIWSSNTRPTIAKILDELGILNKFTKIVSREDVRLLKPYTEGFEKIYDGDPKINYLIIGDGRSEQEPAREIGIDFFLENSLNPPGKYW